MRRTAMGPVVLKCLLVALLACVCLTTLAQAGSIVVSHDEWFTSSGQIGRVDNAQFAHNIANFLTGGSGSILILSTNTYLNNGAFITYLGTWGYTVTTASTLPSNLGNYDAVFLAGTVIDNTALIDYVNSGGGVFLEAGTGWGGAAAEAASWKTFLNAFGLELSSPYNGVSGDINVSAFQGQGLYGPALFGGVNLVSTVYSNNGNSVVDLGTNPAAQVFSTNTGLYGAVKTYHVTPTPEPSSLILLGSGLLGFAMTLRRRLRG